MRHNLMSMYFWGGGGGGGWGACCWGHVGEGGVEG